MKPGLLGAEWGETYDRLFRDRIKGDYDALATFEAGDVRNTIGDAAALVAALEALLPEQLRRPSG